MSSTTALMPGYVPAHLRAGDADRDGMPNRLDLWLGAVQGGLQCRLGRVERSLQPIVSTVQALQAECNGLDEEALRLHVAAAARAYRRDPRDVAATSRVMACVCEAAGRLLGLHPYPVQVLGALVLLRGGIAEMATGEGKTLTAALAAVCGALRGQPVHVVTVNDYLAKRDGESLAPLFTYFGLSVGVVQGDQTPAQRQAAYACHVTYCTNKDVVFDYLRTQLSLGLGRSPRRAWLRGALGEAPPEGRLVERLGLAIVDEADSILVDEARTPLVISRERDTGLAATCAEALELSAGLQRDEHFLLDEETRLLDLTESGREVLRDITRDRRGVWSAERQREHLCLQALAALHSYRRDRDYIVRDGKVLIVDEFTGRVLPDRSWERGLHQMIEAKEGCEITPHRESIARMTYQRFFRRYETLAGMTGTAAEIAGELWAVYGLQVVRIPTHRPVLRKVLPTRLFRSATERWQGVAERCREVSAQGRAVLVGTRSVQQSEVLSACLDDLAVPHRVLNAKQDRDEAEIVAMAGQPGRVTVATNMAGRGTDIRLHPEVAAGGGLHVILTEFHDSRRIDRQLYGRGARQGDPGSCEAMVSLDDDIFVRFAPQARALLLRRAVDGGEQAPWQAELLRGLAQSRAQSGYSRARLDTLRQEAQMERMLGFAGRSE